MLTRFGSQPIGWLLLSLLLCVGCKSKADPVTPAAPPVTSSQTPKLPSEDTAPAIEPAPQPSEANATEPARESSAQSKQPPTWMAQLASSSATERDVATAQLQQQDNATQLLLEFIDASDSTVRQGAAFGLLTQFDATNPLHTDAMQRTLSDADPLVRRVALQAVSQWSNEDPLAAEVAVSQLEAVVKNPAGNSFDRAQAVRILGRLGSAAAPALIDTFRRNGDLNVRKAALAAAMRTNPSADQIAKPLISLLNDDPNAALRRQAATHLREFGSDGDVQQALATALSDQDSEVRLEAANSLAAQGASALDVTIELLDSDNAQQRLYAIFVLGKMGTAAEPALAKLRQLASDPNADVATTAARVIQVIEAGGR